MVEIKGLLEYNDIVRHRYFECFASLSWNEFVKDRGASWGSIRNIFIHTLGAIDYWLDFLQREKLHAEKRYDEYGSFDEVKAYMEHVESRMRNYVNSLSARGLKEKYVIKNDLNVTVEITTEDVLIHVFEEEVHHRGEFIALLRQMDVEPPLMGWKEL